MRTSEVTVLPNGPLYNLLLRRSGSHDAYGTSDPTFFVTFLLSLPFQLFPIYLSSPFTANLHFSKNADCDVSCSSIGHTFHFLNPVIKTIILLNNRRSSFCVHGSYHTPLHFWWISELRKNRLSYYSKRSKDCNKVAILCECSFVKIRTVSNNLKVS